MLTFALVPRALEECDSRGFCRRQFRGLTSLKAKTKQEQIKWSAARRAAAGAVHGPGPSRHRPPPSPHDITDRDSHWKQVVGTSAVSHARCNGYDNNNNNNNSGAMQMFPPTCRSGEAALRRRKKDTLRIICSTFFNCRSSGCDNMRCGCEFRWMSGRRSNASSHVKHPLSSLTYF